MRSARYPPATCPLFVFYLPAIPPPPWALSSRCSTRAHSTRISPPRRRLARLALPAPPRPSAALAWHITLTLLFAADHPLAAADKIFVGGLSSVTTLVAYRVRVPALL